jgi:hypothetical protein
MFDRICRKLNLAIPTCEKELHEVGKLPVPGECVCEGLRNETQERAIYLPSSCQVPSRAQAR